MAIYRMVYNVEIPMSRLYSNDKRKDYYAYKLIKPKVKRTEKIVLVASSTRHTIKTIKPSKTEIDEYMSKQTCRTIAEYKEKREYAEKLLSKRVVNAHSCKSHERKSSRRQTDAEYNMRERMDAAKERQYKICIQKVDSILDNTLDGEYPDVNAYLKADEDLANQIHKIYSKRLKKRDYELINKELPAHVRKESANYTTPKVCRAVNSSKGLLYQRSQRDNQGYNSSLARGKQA